MNLVLQECTLIHGMPKLSHSVTGTGASAAPLIFLAYLNVQLDKCNISDIIRLILDCENGITVGGYYE